MFKVALDHKQDESEQVIRITVMRVVLLNTMIIDDHGEDAKYKDKVISFGSQWCQPGHLDAPEKWKKLPPVRLSWIKSWIKVFMK